MVKAGQPISAQQSFCAMQALDYAASNGLQYAIISNYIFTWALKMEGNRVYISQAYRYSSLKPTVLQVLCS